MFFLALLCALAIWAGSDLNATMAQYSIVCSFDCVLDWRTLWRPVVARQALLNSHPGEIDMHGLLRATHTNGVWRAWKHLHSLFSMHITAVQKSSSFITFNPPFGTSWLPWSLPLSVSCTGVHHRCPCCNATWHNFGLWRTFRIVSPFSFILWVGTVLVYSSQTLPILWTLLCSSCSIPPLPPIATVLSGLD